MLFFKVTLNDAEKKEAALNDMPDYGLGIIAECKHDVPHVQGIDRIMHGGVLAPREVMDWIVKVKEL